MNSDNMNSDITIIVKPMNYYDNFKNTDKLPITPIFKLIEHEYEVYLSEPKNIPSLSNIFEIPNIGNYLQPRNGKFTGANIASKPSFSLEKFISYLIYTKSSYLLKEKGNAHELNIPGIKSQIGKDITRVDLQINSQIQNFKTMIGGRPTPTPEIVPHIYDLSIALSKEEEEDIKQTSKLLEENYDKITDKYYEILMSNLLLSNEVLPSKELPSKELPSKELPSNEKSLINFNILNEIGLLSCQNIFNFIAEFIQIEIKNITQYALKDNYLLISPSSREDAQGKETISNPKTLNVELENGNKIVRIYLDSYLFTSSDFTAVGRISFTLSINLDLNTFQLDKLDIEYNLEGLTEKPKYTLAQTAKYYGITKPTQYIKKRIFTSKGGKTKKSKKSKKTRKHHKREKK